jgi:hypothetical protein
MNYDRKLTKAQNNVKQIDRARERAKQYEQDPNYPEQQKEWLKEAKMEKPYPSLSQMPSQPKAPKKIKQIEPTSQQDNWMTRRHDPFRKNTESVVEQSQTQTQT